METFRKMGKTERITPAFSPSSPEIEKMGTFRKTDKTERMRRGSARDGGEGEIFTEQQRSCATVEEMGKGFASGSEKESLRVRELIKRHFEIYGMSFDCFLLWFNLLSVMR